MAKSSAASSSSEHEEEIFTIKCGLVSKCKNDQLFQRIQEDVETISRWAVESSDYVHYVLNKEFEAKNFPNSKINFETYFNQLKVGKTSTRESYQCVLEYQDIRDEFGLMNYDIGNQNSGLFTIKQYETMFINNIVIHAYKRVDQFLKNVQKLVFNEIATTSEAKQTLYSRRKNVLDHVFNCARTITSSCNYTR